jgi:hypothetical protein
VSSVAFRRNGTTVEPAAGVVDRVPQVRAGGQRFVVLGANGQAFGTTAWRIPGANSGGRSELPVSLRAVVEGRWLQQDSGRVNW